MRAYFAKVIGDHSPPSRFYDKRKPPKVASLTGAARREIQKGLLTDGDQDSEGPDVVEVSEEEFNALWEELETLETRIDTLTQNQNHPTNPENQTPSTDTPDESSSGGGRVGVDAAARERIEEVAGRVQHLGEVVDALDNGAPKNVGSAPAVQRLDARVAELEEDVGALEEYVYEWTGFAETYFLAIRRVLEEQLDINMDSYLQTTEQADDHF